MKFSDMMGKRDRGTADVEPQLPPEAATAPPVPEAPIRFVGNRTELDDAAAAIGGGSITPPAPPAPPAPPLLTPEVAAETTTAPVAAEPQAPPVQPSISDVVAELAPRPAAATNGRPLDASAWLDGVSSIDDDLLPH